MTVPTLLSKVNLLLQKENIEGIVIEISEKSIDAISRDPKGADKIIKQRYNIQEEEGIYKPKWHHFLLCQDECFPYSGQYKQYDEILRKKGL
ncbi:MAG: hypothetical protein AABW50_03220 [Nanoarchaeota archaeon]